MSALVVYTNSGGDGPTINWPNAGPPDQRWNFVTGQLTPIAGLIGYGDGSITFEDGRSFPQTTPSGSTFFHVPLEHTPYTRVVLPPAQPPPVTPPVIPPVTPPVLVPVVTSATFSFATNATLSTGQVIGEMVATNTPTSWTITGGNTPANFAIDKLGNITLTALGVTNLANLSGTAELVVRAGNSAGSGTGVATINYQAQGVVPPVVTSASFNLNTNLTLTTGQVVGTMTAISNAPLSWAILSGNDGGDFMIDSFGNLTLTFAGASNLPQQSGTAILVVQATNSAGSGTGTATIVYQPI